MSAAAVTYAVDPARLHWGHWCHTTDREIGRSDIHASYSADRIGMDQPIRKPFAWKGALWICTGFSSGEAEAYRLRHPYVFDGQPTTYRPKSRTAENAKAVRNDPNGFCHGMTVKHAPRRVGKNHYAHIVPSSRHPLTIPVETSTRRQIPRDCPAKAHKIMTGSYLVAI